MSKKRRRANGRFTKGAIREYKLLRQISNLITKKDIVSEEESS